MKKLISIIMVAVLVLSMGVQCFAYTVDRDEFYPIIIVAGYGSSAQYVDNGDGTTTHAWNIDIGLILKRVLARSFDLAMGIGELTKGNAEKIGNTVGEEFVNMFGCLSCNPDGSSVYNVKRYCSYNAAESNYTYFLEHDQEEYCFEPEIMAMYGSYMGDNWTDYIFNYNTDFRMSVTDCAADLDRYVDSVLAYTGAEKVNLYCVSHGGQIGSTFLNLYGEKKADKLNNVILTVPAIGGAGLAYDVLMGEIDFDEENLVYFVENGMMFEEDYHWLVANENLDFLDDLLTCLVPYLQQVMGYWGSLWDFVPAKDYEKVKAACLDSKESAELIGKCDYFHYDVYPQMRAKFLSCMDKGVNVYIVAGSGANDIAGYDVNSDAIIPVVSSTGATCADWGCRFNDGYTTLNTTCKDKTHNHLSPDMEIDLSTGYLPEQTWVVDGLYHGMTIKSDYCTDLITMLMFTDELVDVHTYKEFPQFHADTNRCQGVTAYFNNSVEGYVSSADNALVIENCSKKYPVRLVSISCDGIDIDFNSVFFKEIPVGGKLEVPFTGSIANVSKALASVTINYLAIGSITPIASRKLDFTILNGESCSFNAAVPQLSKTSENDTALNFILGLIPSLGMQKFVTIIYNSIKALIMNVK